MSRRMNRTVEACLAALLLAGGSSRAVAGGGVHVSVGARWNSGGEPYQADSTLAGGVHFDIGRSVWPVNIALGYQLGVGDLMEDGEEIGDLDVHEAYAGIVRARGAPSLDWRALAGAGISRAAVRAEQTVFANGTDIDAAPGIYAHAGAFFAPRPNRLVALGIEARAMLGGRVEVLGIDGSTSYVQLAVIFGGFGD